MAYFSVSRRDGNYCCQVRWYPFEGAKRKSKNKTFKSKVAAKSWGKAKVAELEMQISLGVDTVELESNIKTFGELIRKYLDDEHISMGRSKRFSLEAIITCDIANIDVGKLRPKHIVDYCKDRKSSGTSPATIACDVSHMRAVLKSALALYDVNVSQSAIVEATPTLHALNLIGKGNIRSRRPTSEDIDSILASLEKIEARDGTIISYVDIFNFSILSCMRIGEVCKILWKDLDEEGEWVWVRDRKDPRKKIGNHMKVPLLGGVFDILKRQPKTDDPRIFPFNARSVTAGNRRAR